MNCKTWSCFFHYFATFAGCRCSSASHGLEAVELMRTKGADAFDFVLMDNYMPVMDGPTACVHMRTVHGPNGTPGIGYRRPIIGLTGHALGEDLQVRCTIAFSECLVAAE